MTEVDAPAYLFDRPRTAHPWLDALRLLQMSPGPGHPALAQNWRMDARVGVRREHSLLDSNYFPSTGHQPVFDQAIRTYFGACQCRPISATDLPGYFDDANAGNLIPWRERPARNHHLLHFASIDRLLGRALKGVGSADFRVALRRLTASPPPLGTSADEVAELVATLQRRGNDAIQGFARALSDALGPDEPLWWAMFAHEISDLSGQQDWTFAARQTGLGHLHVGEWLLAWRYSPEIAGRLYRPTVAEANNNAFHFPSPPDSHYGIAMPLAAGLPAVRELIHPPLKGETCAAACLGSIGRIESEPAAIPDPDAYNEWLRLRRQGHGHDLARSGAKGTAA